MCLLVFISFLYNIYCIYYLTLLYAHSLINNNSLAHSINTQIVCTMKFVAVRLVFLILVLKSDFTRCEESLHTHTHGNFILIKHLQTFMLMQVLFVISRVQPLNLYSSSVMQIANRRTHTFTALIQQINDSLSLFLFYIILASFRAVQLIYIY